MAKNFFQRIETSDGAEVMVHVNRRGCKGQWTKKDAEALQALVEAARTLDLSGARLNTREAIEAKAPSDREPADG